MIVFLPSLVNGWWFTSSLLGHGNFTSPFARSPLYGNHLLPVIPLGQAFQVFFQSLPPHPIVPFSRTHRFYSPNSFNNLQACSVHHIPCGTSGFSAGSRILVAVLMCPLWQCFLAVSLLTNQLGWQQLLSTDKLVVTFSVLWKLPCLELSLGTGLSTQRIYFPGFARATCTVWQSSSFQVNYLILEFSWVERKLFTKSVLIFGRSTNGQLLHPVFGAIPQVKCLRSFLRCFWCSLYS